MVAVEHLIGQLRRPRGHTFRVHVPDEKRDGQQSHPDHHERHHPCQYVEAFRRRRDESLQPLFLHRRVDNLLVGITLCQRLMDLLAFGSRIMAAQHGAGADAILAAPAQTGEAFTHAADIRVKQIRRLGQADRRYQQNEKTTSPP